MKFANGVVENHTANTIAKNVISQVNSDGHEYLLLNEISDHRKDHTAIKKSLVVTCKCDVDSNDPILL